MIKFGFVLYLVQSHRAKIPRRLFEAGHVVREEFFVQLASVVYGIEEAGEGHESTLTDQRLIGAVK